MIWGRRRPRLGEPVRVESSSREDVVRRPQAVCWLMINLLSRWELVVRKKEWSRWAWPSPDRDGTMRMLRTDVLYGQMSDLPTATFPEAARGLPYLWQCSLRFAFWELSYVNGPTVNIKSCSMNVAPGTSFRCIFSFVLTILVRTTCNSFWIWLTTKLLCIMYPRYWCWDLCLLRASSMNDKTQTYSNCLLYEQLAKYTRWLLSVIK